MTECCICLVELENTQIIKLECCNNYIHQLCNDNLINNNINNCPLCRCKLNYVTIDINDINTQYYQQNEQNQETINILPCYKLIIISFVVVFIVIFCICAFYYNFTSKN